MRRGKALLVVGAIVLVVAVFAYLKFRRTSPAGSYKVASAYVGEGEHSKPNVVIFVHGVFGDETSFGSGASSFPKLLASDPAFKDDVDVSPLNIPAHFLGMQVTSLRWPPHALGLRTTSWRSLSRIPKSPSQAKAQAKTATPQRKVANYKLCGIGLIRPLPPSPAACLARVTLAHPGFERCQDTSARTRGVVTAAVKSR